MTERSRQRPGTISILSFAVLQPAVLAVVISALAAVVSCTPAGNHPIIEEKRSFQTEMQEGQLRRQDPWAAEKHVRCERERKSDAAERRNKHFGDYVVDVITDNIEDALFGPDTSCDDSLPAPPAGKWPLDDDKAVDTLIDKQMKDALSKTAP